MPDSQPPNKSQLTSSSPIVSFFPTDDTPFITKEQAKKDSTTSPREHASSRRSGEKRTRSESSAKDKRK